VSFVVEIDSLQKDAMIRIGDAQKGIILNATVEEACRNGCLKVKYEDGRVKPVQKSEIFFLERR
jgi:hypothetical protein